MANAQRTNNWQNAPRPSKSRALKSSAPEYGGFEQGHAGSNFMGSHDADAFATNGDWNSLQDQLEDLLDQVHLRQQDQFQHQGEYGRRGENPMPAQNFGELDQDKFDQDEFDQGKFDPEEYRSPLSPRANRNKQSRGRYSQHSSSQYAPDRSNETEEAFVMPAQSARQLQNAIHQIRSRKQQRPRNQNHEMSGHLSRGHQQNAPERFNEFGTALGDISSRLARFEQILASQNNSSTPIAEMATQIEQLCGVVEHLASNVGEQSQIKRLESQIARLADAIPEGNDLDFKSLNQRLDVLSNAFEKLQDLQTRQLDFATIATAGGDNLDALEPGVKNILQRMDDLEQVEIDLEPIEKCVRSIYDRIDALEQTMSKPNPDIEWLSRDMAEFTKAMKSASSNSDSAELIERVDTLVARIEQIESQGSPVGSIKSEIQNLQSSLLNAVEPRFEALEQQLGSLKDNFSDISTTGQQPEISVDILEKHIQNLARKLDETNSEISGLQQVFTKGDEANSSPDINAIADMVANRTYEAMEKLQAQSGNGFEQNALDELEGRLSGLFKSQANNNQNGDFVNVRKSIDQVNERLSRLEVSLEGVDKGSSDAAAIDSVDLEFSKTQHSEFEYGSKFEKDLEQEPKTSIGSGQVSKPEKPLKHLLPELADNMPRPPAEEAPLNAPVFGKDTEFKSDQNSARVPVPASLRVDPDDLLVMENEVHEIDEPHPARHSPYPSNFEATDTVDPEDVKPIKIPHFNEEKTSAPPTPQSTFAQGQSPIDKLGDRKKTPSIAPQDSRVSRSTFIEAARRAVKSSSQMQAQEEEQSLIGRAIARFQKKSAAVKENEAEENNSAKDRTSLAGDNQETEFADKQEGQSEEYDDLTTVPESFLSRNRQPILLVAALAAVTLLTINLVSQRFSAPQVDQVDAVAQIDSGDTIVDKGANNKSVDQGATSTNASPAPDETPSQATSSLTSDNGGDGGSQIAIDSSEGVRIIDPMVNQEAPASLNLASLTSVGASVPLQGFELPPEAIGPLQLRQAAQDGDPRAQFEIAAIFAEGRAITQDLSAASVWYERSAAQGFAPAGYRLANMLENGIGVEKDLARARLWYQLAADAGNRMSMHNLASLMASGQLGEPQFDLAAYWFEKAADLGLKDSQFNLAMLNARGLGVPQNLENAFKWFSIAASLGDEDAAKARDDIARSLNAQSVPELQNKIAAWQAGNLNILANFAPIGTWTSDFDPGADIDNAEVIVRVQAVLNRLGFDAGTPDGVMGPKTSDAIVDFERQVGMAPSGAINPRLLAVLGSQPV